MEELATRIRRIAGELEAVQEQLNDAALHPQTSQLALPFEDIRDFKLAVDNMRNFLWSYLEAGAMPDWESTVQTFRMQRATDMLRSVRTQLEQHLDAGAPETHSFFEEINSLANVVVDKHLVEHSPAQDSED